MLIPSREQLDNWRERVLQLADALADSGLHHDLGTVLHRVERERARQQALEAGCAWRVLQLATALARADQFSLATLAHELAFELAAHELNPSPTWATMCVELGWPREVAPSTDRAAHLPVEGAQFYAGRTPNAEIILIAFAPARLYYARGRVGDCSDRLARRLFPLTLNGRAESGVTLCFVFALGVFADLYGDGAFDNAGLLHGDATDEHERLLREHVQRYGARGLAGLGSSALPASRPKTLAALARLPFLAAPTPTATADTHGELPAPTVPTALARGQAHAEVVARRAGGRVAKLDAFLDRLGVDPDKVVAEAAGVTAKTVRIFRERRGIPCA